MPGCAVGPCGRTGRREPEVGLKLGPDGRYHCAVCYLAIWFPPIVRCPELVDRPRVGTPVRCRKVADHDGPCAPPQDSWRPERAELKDAKPRRDLSAPGAAAAALAFVKRKRVGPHQ